MARPRRGHVTCTSYRGVMEKRDQRSTAAGKDDRVRTLAHVSDLHIGKNAEADARARGLGQALVEAGVDHVLVTGDITHRGRLRELATFAEAFAPLARLHRLTVIPGNHDRLGDDLEEAIMPGARVQVATAPGLHIVRVNSTGPHNRSWLASQGALHAEDVEAVAEALRDVPDGHLPVIAVHHHVVPLPEEHAMERLSSWLGWPFTSELELGWKLLDRARARASLVLHGHRHVPRGIQIFEGDRPVWVYNAGSSTALGAVRIFRHAAGTVLGAPRWLVTAPSTSEVGTWGSPDALSDIPAPPPAQVVAAAS
jgi:3',5'-cyclic AMP phosphodiesterase CpdA